MPLITIITPVLNHGDALSQCIESVRSQSFTDWEHIILDGGSKDNTLEILGGIKDARVRWVSEKDGGIYDAMRKGVAMARGSWVYFLGADDVLVDCLHKVVPHLRNENRVVYGDVYFRHKNKVYGGKFDATRLAVQNISHQAIFYPKPLFRDVNYRLEYRLLADYVLNLEIWGTRKFNFLYVPVLICLFDDSGRSNKLEDLDFQRDKASLIAKCLGKDLSKEKIRNDVLRWLANIKRALRPSRSSPLAKNAQA